ncbi:TraB/GumN family protein [Aquicoccus sp. SCR17]|nr:TraB/GumN family protein [Carideicomes alvinocaridis]
MRLICTVLLWLGLALPALAACEGQDLRAGLDAEERAFMAERLEGMPYPRGNHWRATRGDSVLHLVGTMHLDDPRHGPVAERLAPLVSGARLLLVEMAPAEQEKLLSAMAEQPGLLTLEAGPSLIDRMDETEWQRLAEAARSRGVPAFMAAKFRPWYLMMLLSTPPCATPSPGEVPEGLDQRLMDLAKDAAVPVRSLEDYDTVFRIFEEIPMAEQLEMLRGALMPKGMQEDAFATMLDAYFDQELGQAYLLGRIVGTRQGDLSEAELDRIFAETRDTMLTARNEAWMPRILDALDRPGEGPVVVAVGGAHLIGAEGLPALLEARGFRLERAAF